MSNPILFKYCQEQNVTPETFALINLVYQAPHSYSEHYFIGDEALRLTLKAAIDDGFISVNVDKKIVPTEKCAVFISNLIRLSKQTPSDA